MTAVNKLEIKQGSSNGKPDRLTKIIDKLSGGNSSLRVDVQEVRLAIGDKQLDIGGRVEFILHGKDGNALHEGVNIQGKFQNGMPAASSSGKALIYTGELEVLRINAAGKRIDLDIEDKDFVKRVIKLRDEITPKKPSTTEKKEKKKSSPLGTVRTVAETMQKLGITLTVSYQGRRIATIGAEAHPTLVQIVTRTHALSIDSTLTALKMMI